MATFAFESVCSFGMFKFKMWLHNTGRVVKPPYFHSIFGYGPTCSRWSS